MEINFQSIPPDKSISFIVKNIWVFSSLREDATTRLPFFADGYPGLLFHQAKNGLIVHPHEKLMPDIFLYGQTIKPIELVVSGAYNIIIFQLYPFVLKSFFNVAPNSINDSCYYLEDAMPTSISTLIKSLHGAKTPDKQIKIISKLLLSHFEAKKQRLDFKVRQAIELIIQTNGQKSIQEISERLKVSIRTFERRFLNETGLSPKQFSKIIQFQASLEQLTIKDFKKLTDIVYQNGFSDQSHFIRVFKEFTGKTPKLFKQ